LFKKCLNKSVERKEKGDDVIKSSQCIASSADPSDVACGEHLAAFTTREPLHVRGVFRPHSHYTQKHNHTHVEPAAGMQLQLDKTIKLGTPQLVG